MKKKKFLDCRKVPHENKICMRHIQLFGTKIYFDSIEIYGKSIICQTYFCEYI